MTLLEAKSVMEAVMTEYAEKFRALGIIAEVRTYYTDKKLTEYPAPSNDSRAVWCDLTIGAPEIDEDDYIIFSLSAEIKRGSYEPEGIKELKWELDRIVEELSASENPVAYLIEECEKTKRECEASMAEFEKKLEKMRMTSKILIGILIAATVLSLILSLI